MAMLAGPRRKQKVINLRAKNNEWSNDSNKFGQRMLEKMGWSSGKGLGVKENGIVEHVVARYKNDDKGLGFEDKNDQWTKHEDDFNSLLANLSNADDNKDKLHSGVSLEVKSKKSKARVHYHKFTRGKDLTRYSEKDLANIFGKKSLREEEKPEELAQEEEQSTEKVFTEKGSMEDYFKNKLANLKSKSKLLYTKECEDDNADYAFKGFSTSEENPTPSAGFTFYSSPTNICENNVNNEDNTPEDEQKIKKKKKKKNKNKDLEITENNAENEHLSCENTIESTNCDMNSVSDEPEIRKKSKKKKKSSEEPVQNEVEETNPKKTKGKNKHNIDNAQDPPQDAETVNAEQNDYIPKKKKKRKNKELVE